VEAAALPAASTHVLPVGTSRQGAPTMEAAAPRTSACAAYGEQPYAGEGEQGRGGMVESDTILIARWIRPSKRADMSRSTGESRRTGGWTPIF
jgi:hypothetical protein